MKANINITEAVRKHGACRCLIRGGRNSSLFVENAGYRPALLEQMTGSSVSFKYEGIRVGY